MRRMLLAVLVMLTIGVGLHAQTFRGAINGTVTDPSGSSVPNATVKATESATGIDHTTITTTDGQFAFQDLPLGTYKLTVTAAGFPANTTDNVTVTAGQIYTLTIKLSLGQQATSVEVSAAAITLDTTTQTETTTLPDTIVQDIPLNGRDFTQLISVAPGYGGYSVGGFGSLNGTRPNQMNWQIDGVDNNDFWHNIPAVNQGGVSGIAGVVLPVDSIDEFSAQTQSGAESGRNAGGTVNLVIKSGGNGLHGSAYYYNRNEFYGAASPFFTKSATVTKAPPLRNQNYGFTAGGPIIKNKTFFFLGFEKQQYIIGLSGLATEPSDAWVNKALAVLQAHGVAPSPLSTKLIGPSGFWPRSLIGGLPGTPNNFFSPVASTGYSYNGIVKLDHNFTDKEHLSVRWFVGQGSQTAPLGGSPALGTASSNLKDYFEVAPLHVQNWSLILNSVLSPKLTNQVLFGINYFNQVFSDFNNSFDTKALGLFLSPDATNKGKPILGAPNIVIGPNGGSFEQIGLTPPEGRSDATGHLTDIVSYTTGKHQMRFGAEVRQGRVNEFYHRRGTGKFTFDGTQGPWANDANVDIATKSLADFMAGDVVSSTIAVGNPERFVTVNAFNFYFQDAFQLTRKLNINFGLRYDYFGPLHSDKKDLAVFTPNKGLQIQGNGIDNIFPPDKNNFAPRIGFAYQPTATNNLVVRGGIGVFYDQINMNPFLDFRPPITAAQGLEGNPIGPNAVSTYSRGTYSWDAAQTGGASIFPGVTICGTLNVATQAACGAPNYASGANLYNVFGVSQNFRVPYFYNYNLQVERSIGNAAILQVGYVGSQGRKLNIMLNINPTPGGTGPNAFFGPLNTAYPNIGSVLQLNSIGTSNYNSLQTIFRVRSWHGLTSQFAYTWGHALDEISEYRAVIADSLNPKVDYGNGDYDTRHNFTASFNYEIPKASFARGWSSYLVNGWQLSSLWSFHTGQPYDGTRSGLDLIGDPFSGISHKFSAAAGGEQWLNPTAFATNGTGNLARNKFYGPGYGAVDFSVFKNIPVTERIKVQLRAEMFNLFNRVNLASGLGSVNLTCAPNKTAANPNQCTSASGFGLVSDTIGDFNGAPGIGPGEAFNIQLVAKIIF